MKKDYLWNTIGVFAQNAISPLLLIVVTRINGIFDSGLFSFAFSVAIIFWVVGMWGGRTYQVSDMSKEFSHHSYLMVRLILAVVVIIGSIVFVIINNYDFAKSSIILSLVLFKAVESIADAIHGVLQVHGRLYIVGKSLLYKAIAGFSLFAIIDIMTRNIILGSFGIILANILLVLFYDLRIAGRFASLKFETTSHLRESIRGAVNIMRRTWPVFIVVFLAMFSLNIPRYFIDLYHEEQIGYFGILAMPITLIALVMTFILQPKVVHLSDAYNKKNYIEFNRTVKGLMLVTAALGLVIFAGAYLVGVPVLNIVFGANFSEYHTALTIIVAGGIVNALVSIFINIFTIIRRFKYQFYILLLTNILLALFSAGFIKQFGLQGGVTLFATINIVQLFFLVIAYKLTLKKIMSAPLSK